jgi:hypothetical protein
MRKFKFDLFEYLTLKSRSNRKIVRYKLCSPIGCTYNKNLVKIHSVNIIKGVITFFFVFCWEMQTAETIVQGLNFPNLTPKA